MSRSRPSLARIYYAPISPRRLRQSKLLNTEDLGVIVLAAPSWLRRPGSEFSEHYECGWRAFPPGGTTLNQLVVVASARREEEIRALLETAPMKLEERP